MIGVAFIFLYVLGIIILMFAIVGILMPKHNISQTVFSAHVHAFKVVLGSIKENGIE